MKVCIPFKPAASGGPSIFFKKLNQALESRGVATTSSWSNDCDIVLAIIYAPPSVLLRAKLRKVPVVQRLDGVYYPAGAGRRWWMLNLPIWITYHFFSNWVIFQSQYSQRVCERFLGAPRCSTSLIYNGVDLKLFNPYGPTKKLADGTIILTLLSKFIRESEILPVIETFDHLQSRFLDAQLVVIGKFATSFEHIPKNRPDIIWIEHIPNHQLPEVHRGVQLMISTKLRSPCPNAVLEAMACGLPIVCFDSGAHSELIGDEAGICLPLSEEDEFGPLPSSLDSVALADASGRILRNRETFALQARRRAEQHFGLDQMVEQYLEAFENVISLPRN
jgi:glycosyltransferase involved in cell wall biosynthesis